MMRQFTVLVALLALTGPNNNALWVDSDSVVLIGSNDGFCKNNLTHIQLNSAMNVCVKESAPSIAIIIDGLKSRGGKQ